MKFTITHTQGNARAGIIHTKRGDIQTPHFVPVATIGAIKALDTADLEALGAQCALANTYHLYLRPGLDILQQTGGVSGMMDFHKPWFSDSGGFQAFSLGIGREYGIGKIGAIRQQKDESKPAFAKVTDEGVAFQSVYDGSKHFFTPRDSMQIQSIIGADIIMAFDECTAPMADKEYQKTALARTHAWAKESLQYKDPKQALYGIVQGGQYEDLRKESAVFTNSLPFDGIAIGGSFGDSVHNMYQIIDWVIPLLDDRPRHLLGIGTVKDIFEGVERGIDTFDCVTPTRNARRGSLYIRPESGGRGNFYMNIDKTVNKTNLGPIDPHCTCPVCQRYSLAYLHHLFNLKELTFYRLASIHNLHFFFTLMQEIRESIKTESFHILKQKWLQNE